MNLGSDMAQCKSSKDVAISLRLSPHSPLSLFVALFALTWLPHHSVSAQHPQQKETFPFPSSLSESKERLGCPPALPSPQVMGDRPTSEQIRGVFTTKPMQLNCKTFQSKNFNLSVSTLTPPPSHFPCVQQC